MKVMGDHKDEENCIVMQRRIINRYFSKKR